MNNTLISVIVTVYNIEPYIMRCVESLIGQTYHNLEIILVNDGSTDRSGQICDEAAAKDERIHVIHKPHEGVSAVRNAGLAAANGEYIGFVDGDDWVDSNMYQAMHDACVKYQAQIAVCRYKKVGEESQNKGPTDAVVCLNRNEAMEIYVCGHEQYIIYPSVWSKLFHKNVVEGLQFVPGKESEDIMFSTQALNKVEKCVYLDTPYYTYVANRQGSIMNKKIGERRFAHEIPFWKEQTAYLQKEGMTELAEKSKYHFYRRMLFYYLEFKKKKGREYEKRMISLLRGEKDEIEEVYKNSFVAKGDKARMKLFLKSPWLYYYVVKIYDGVIIPIRNWR